MSIINQPPTTSVDQNIPDGSLVISNEWRNFFSSVYNICNALTMSGATANRPTKMLWTGRTYFDTTLGKPIWYKTAGWVDATGGAV